MAYTAINLADIEAGKPVKEEIFQTIRSNEESFNTDIEALKQTSIIDVFNVKFGGSITQYTEAQISSRVPVFRCPIDGTLTTFVITLLTASTSGTLEIGLEKSTDNGVNWTSLLDTPVTLSGTTVGSLSGAVDWTSPASQNFLQTNLLRLVISNTQVSQGEFQVSIYGEVA
jgi:hypothetical protein